MIRWSQKSKFLTRTLACSSRYFMKNKESSISGLKTQIISEKMMDLLFKAVQKSLDLEENSLLGQFGDNPIMSNGISKSPLHRAVMNKAKLSISVATIYEPDPEP
ncbi:hypothetical protein V6N13_058229 [Hibiscus sabdariffa]